MLKSLKTGLNYSILYEYGDEYVYFIGGKPDFDEPTYNKCVRINIYTLSWSSLTNMIHNRLNPGVFMSNDKQYIYAYGG